VKVLYSSRDFVGWWLNEQSRLKLIRPTISRKDHSKNYAFGNINLEEQMVNCADDVLRRHGPVGLKRSIPVAMYRYSDMKLLKVFSSGMEASRETGIKRANIDSLIKGYAGNGRTYNKTRDGITFRRLGGVT
jgi:hypothetical protein